MTPHLSRRAFLARSTAALAALPLLSSKAFAGETKPAGRKLGVALAGLGYYSSAELAPALLETKYCKLAAVITGNRDKGRKWASRHHFPDTSVYHYDTMDQLASNPEVDIVYIVTPPGLHRLHVERAAAAGKHVICEKPMAPTTEDCDAMIAACRRAGRQLSIGYRLHYDPFHQELMRLATTNEFGAFKHIQGAHGFHVGQYNWRINRALAGGGPLPDVGIYSLHAACMAANAEPVAVTAKELPKSRPDFFTEVEEGLRWTMEFPNGARAECETSYNEGMNTFRAEGDKGWFALEPAYYYRGIRGRTSKGALEFPEVRQQALHLDAIALAILESREVPTPGELGRRDVKIMEAIYRAMKSGTRVSV
ncbi:Gfo/Idh/MocA family protein [Nibricoccus sp. IMCC34717]|uniref:Gfo/Idh/MocA family protein n=1 Tax=Nibricoccus sp. IMCC34717 TaxID=3034021 RepID=UPI00384F77A8